MLHTGFFFSVQTLSVIIIAIMISKVISYRKNLLHRPYSRGIAGRILSSTTISSHSDSTRNPVFDERKPFQELLNDYPFVIPYLRSKNLADATTIQAKSIPKILSGADVIIGAETGSGKTLSYMLPLVLKYGTSCTANSTFEKKRGLVLAPTNDLCDQIKSMTDFLFGAVRSTESSVILDRRPDSFFNWLTSPEKLHVTLCTPRAVADAVRHSDHFAPDHPFRALDFFVLDEADMLMEGSYVRDVETILDKLRLVRRALIQEGQLGINARKTQFVLAAATIPTYGLKSTRNLIKQTFPHAIEVKTQNLHQHHPSITQEFLPIAGDTFLTKVHVDIIVEKVLAQAQSFPSSSPPSSTPFTLSDLPFSVMIFLNTANHARQLFSLFQGAGYGGYATEVHSLLSKEEREQNLQVFRAEGKKIMICTDACARGLDIPHVRYVVQGEFALNVVQHMHRVGRASRGGRIGAALNLYTPESKLLVDSIMGVVSAAHSSQPDTSTVHSSIENSFSRKRGFRQKFKRSNSQKAQNTNPLNI